GPGQTSRDADHVLAFRLAEAEPPDAGIFVEVAAGDADPLALFHQDVFDRFARQIGDLALEVANPSLARVVADQIAQRVVADVPFGLFEAVRLDLLRDQVALSDRSEERRVGEGCRWQV